MTIEARLIALAQAVGSDVKIIKAVEGNLDALTTATKASLVSAINEIVAALSTVQVGGLQINDAATNGDTTVTWSADKIYDELALAAQAVKDSILGGAGAAFDTLIELQEALGNDAAFASTITNGLNNRIRFDAAQVLSAEQKTQARENMDAASVASVAAVIVSVNDLNVNLTEAINVVSGGLGVTNGNMDGLFTNLGETNTEVAAVKLSLNNLKAGLGDFDHDLVSEYNTAKV